MSRQFILDADGNPVVEPDRDRFWRWMEANEVRRDVRITPIDDLRVITRFHGNGCGIDERELFKTGIEQRVSYAGVSEWFAISGRDALGEWTATRAEAIAAHTRAVDRALELRRAS